MFRNVVTVECDSSVKNMHKIYVWHLELNERESWVAKQPSVGATGTSIGVFLPLLLQTIAPACRRMHCLPQRTGSPRSCWRRTTAVSSRGSIFTHCIPVYSTLHGFLCVQLRMTSIHIQITGQEYNVPCSAAGLCKLLKFVFDLRDFFLKYGSAAQRWSVCLMCSSPQITKW